MKNRQTTDGLKLPPYSIEAEQAILGALLFDPTAFDRVADIVRADDFYQSDHRLIFGAVVDLNAADQPADIVTVAEHLSARIDEIGGMQYLAAIARDTPSSANVTSYAEIVRDLAQLRRLAAAATEIANDVYAAHDDNRDAAAVLDAAEQKLLAVREGSTTERGFLDLNQLTTQAVERIDQLFHTDSAVTGIATGLTDFDAITAGLQPGDLIILAARPSMGKTSLAMNIAAKHALRHETGVAVFTQEMPGIQLTTRLLSSLGSIPMQRLRTGKLAEDDWPRLTAAVTQLTQAREYLHLDESTSMTPLQIRAKARRQHRKQPLGLIVVDYLQLMQAHGRKIENRQQEIAEISRQLKALAKEINVPLIALSQLNRSLESRSDKRPVMSDLRESGALEQDSDVIGFLYRDEIYNPETARPGHTELIIAKQRNGETGVINLMFLKQFVRFESWADDEDFTQNLNSGGRNTLI